MSVLGTSRCSLHSRQRLEVVAARKARSSKQVAVSRTLIAKKGHESQVASLAGEILKWSQQEREVSGKGLVAIDCVRDGWEPNTFHFWERYESTAAFGEHSTSPQMMEMLKKLQPHLEGPIGMSLYSYEDGRIGPSAIQAGPKGEGGLDDATGASGAAGGASYKQTSRAFDLTKVDEHEEARREQLLLSSMEGPSDAAAAGGKGGEPGGEGKGVRGRLPLPSLQNVWSVVVKVKNQVMAPLCKLLGH